MANHRFGCVNEKLVIYQMGGNNQIQNGLRFSTS